MEKFKVAGFMKDSSHRHNIVGNGRRNHWKKKCTRKELFQISIWLGSKIDLIITHIIYFIEISSKIDMIIIELIIISDQVI